MTPATRFPNYLQTRSRLPLGVWRTLRGLGLAAAGALCVLLVADPPRGLLLFWGFLVPSLPLIFFLAPGLWRNLCPLSTANQIPRFFGFSRALTIPNWLKAHGYVVAIALFLLIVPARKALFDGSGPAAAGLIVAALSAAFVGGWIFKGKSGWCSSICPLLPVQRVYGQTPFVAVRNTHCNPCVGCTKNCYDFNPSVAYLADLYDEDEHYRDYRKFFVGALPGLILAFYTVPSPPEITVLELYLRFGLFALGSAGTFFAVEAFARTTGQRITVVYGAAALTLYYWFTLPLFAARLGDLASVQPPMGVVEAGQVVVFGVALTWIARTARKEPSFLAAATAPSVRVEASTLASLGRATHSEAAEVAILPDGPTVAVKPGATLLETIESSGRRIEAGCRMGVCGADPVAVASGMEGLSAPSSDEKNTLERLGLAPNTRMACCARVLGNVAVRLTPDRRQAPAVPALSGFTVDPDARRIVIIGNGIAGTTAADHIRRRHPDCEIHVIGRESHPVYNRMAISRLIYGRSAMHGLYLMPDSWYEDRQITCWLNTLATDIDIPRQEIHLGPGESLGYDRLILAMGSASFVPPVERVDTPGTFVLREADDAMRIRAFAQERACRAAVVAGGGLLGLEAAYALQKVGLRVSVLERSDWLLRRQLDERASELLRRYLEGLGIEVIVRAEADGVEGDGRVTGVRLTDGRQLGCDLLLVCAGITPNVAVARQAGLNVNHGVVVDDFLQTSQPGVFAAGDLAEHRGRISGLWPTAVEQGEVAALNALGGTQIYEPTPPVTILKVVGIDLTSIGRFEPESADEVLVEEDVEQHRYRKIVVADGKIAGAILLGYPVEARTIADLMKQRADVAPVIDALRAGRWEPLGQLAEVTAS